MRARHMTVQCSHVALHVPLRSSDRGATLQPMVHWRRVTDGNPVDPALPFRGRSTCAGQCRRSMLRAAAAFSRATRAGIVPLARRQRRLAPGAADAAAPGKWPGRRGHSGSAATEHTFVSSHFRIDEHELRSYLDRKGLVINVRVHRIARSHPLLTRARACQATPKHFVVKFCPLCARPHMNKPDNLWKLYIKREDGAFFCHRCGIKGSWFDLKRQVAAAVRRALARAPPCLTPLAAERSSETLGSLRPRANPSPRLHRPLPCPASRPPLGRRRDPSSARSTRAWLPASVACCPASSPRSCST